MYQKKKKNGHRPVRVLLIAAVITVLLVTTVYAAVNALVDMRIEDTKINTHNGEMKEGVEVHFEKTEDVYVELDAYYPQWVPEGYEIVFVLLQQFRARLTPLQISWKTWLRNRKQEPHMTTF